MVSRGLRHQLHTARRQFDWAKRSAEMSRIARRQCRELTTLNDITIDL